MCICYVLSRLTKNEEKETWITDENVQDNVGYGNPVAIQVML